MKVLIVDDDQLLCGMLSKAMRLDGYSPDEAKTLAEARRKLGTAQFDLLLVDWNLPDGSGIDLITEYRAAGKSASTIVMTGRNSPDDLVPALDAGADDFVDKPLRINQLRAKIRALSRRAPLWVPQVSTFRDLTVDGDRQIALIGDRPLDLTPKEWQVLWLLSTLGGNLATRARLVAEIWDENHESGLHALDVHVSNLRTKLAAKRARVPIKTRRGAGYQLA